MGSEIRLTSEGSKLFAIVLVAIVLASGFGYWLLTPKMSSPPATYTTQQTPPACCLQNNALSRMVLAEEFAACFARVNVVFTGQTSTRLADRHSRSVTRHAFCHLVFDRQASFPDPNRSLESSKFDQVPLEFSSQPLTAMS